MTFFISDQKLAIQRVRAILLTQRGTLMFIKRVKPGKAPYWVAPGGGVEDVDMSLIGTLRRELEEELGASIAVLFPAFVLEHEKAGKNLQEHFYVCRLIHYDIERRHGPEFEDPDRGQYIPVEIPLDAGALASIDIKTPELRDWLMENITYLRNFM